MTRAVKIMVCAGVMVLATLMPDGLATGQTVGWRTDGTGQESSRIQVKEGVPRARVRKGPYDVGCPGEPPGRLQCHSTVPQYEHSPGRPPGRRPEGLAEELLRALGIP